MALRLANKINRQLVTKICRSLSTKREVPELEPQKAEEASKPAEVSSPPPSTFNAIASKYEVCRPRTSPIAPFPIKVQNEADVARKAVAMQHLQPAMLPEYYKPPIEINAPCMYLDPVTETERQTTAKYRKFEDSKTCENVVLPLRGPKLASPFPDPVKVMQSHTVSDQEKAEQMFAETRMVKGRSDSSVQQRNSSIRTLPPTRNYSDNASSRDKKCKIGHQEEKKKCVHMKLAGCAPIKSISCSKKKKPRPPCTKKLSPYPSYSESCHQDPIEKPSECKICPYKPDEHPHFKPPKQSFHTSTVINKKKSNQYKGECAKPPSEDKQPCGWEKEKTKKPPASKGKQSPKKKAQAVLNEALNAHHFAAAEEDTTVSTKSKMRYTFFSTKAKEQQEQKEAQNVQATPKASESQEALSGGLERLGSGLLYHVEPKDILAESNRSRCTKFPFKECPFEIVKKRPVTGKYEKCPKKPRPKLIQDCPKEEEDNCKTRTSPLSQRLAMLMSDDRNPSDKPKKKCPKINLGICRNPDDYPDDPCKKRRTGKTLICPDDLLSKKPRSKKKTSPIVPLSQIPSAIKSDTTLYTS